MSRAQSYMQVALDEAAEAALRDEVPVGAVVVDGETGEILAADGNRTEELRDATAHAEMLVLREAARRYGGARLLGCDLYVTLEPCAMCAAAISFARIRRLYFGALDAKGGAVEHGPRFFDQPTCHHRPECYGGIDEVRASAMLKEFFRRNVDCRAPDAVLWIVTACLRISFTQISAGFRILPTGVGQVGKGTMRDTLRDAGRNFAGLLIGLSLATVASGAVAGDDEEAAAKAKAAAEAAAKELHSISVFNFVQDWRGRGGAVPVLVTMKVQGGEALDIFCNNVPRVQARILQAVLNGTQRGAARRHGNWIVEDAASSGNGAAVSRKISQVSRYENRSDTIGIRYGYPGHDRRLPRAQELSRNQKGRRPKSTPFNFSTIGSFDQSSLKPYSFQRALTRSMSSLCGATVGG